MTASVIQKTIRALIGIAVIFMLAIAAVGFLTFRLADLDHWTIHTHQVIEQLKDSLAALLDVETGQRGFVNTGDKHFLEPYEWGKESLGKHLDRVGSLIEDNPEQQRNLAVVRGLADEKLKLAATAVEEAQVSNPDPKNVLLASQGKVIMDRYRQQISLMQANESKLLAVRAAELQQAQYAIWTSTTILALFGFGLLAWVYKITREAIEAETRRAVELNTLNAGLLTEIEQRKRTEQALKETTIKLSSSNTDLQQFAYVASHDLQEPLRAVAGFLTLIASKQKGSIDPETEGWINHAVEGSQRMRALINDLLMYARVESRGRDLVSMDCNQSLIQAKKDLSVVIEETKAELVAPDLPHVLGEQGQLAQVFQNLIGNAIKFRSNRKPVIQVDATRQRDEWLFSIKDNGIGFDQEHADRIFIIFQRLQGRDEYKGTGIGLALCKKIIERHGGRIWAESEKGKGSTFFFTIPVMEGDSNGSQINQDTHGGRQPV